MQCNTIQCNAMQCNTMQYNAMQCNTIQYNAIQYNTIQYKTIQYKTIQYNTKQNNTILGHGGSHPPPTIARNLAKIKSLPYSGFTKKKKMKRPSIDTACTRDLNHLVLIALSNEWCRGDTLSAGSTRKQLQSPGQPDFQ